MALTRGPFNPSLTKVVEPKKKVESCLGIPLSLLYEDLMKGKDKQLARS